jgi:hypothetical protein
MMRTDAVTGISLRFYPWLWLWLTHQWRGPGSGGGGLHRATRVDDGRSAYFMIRTSAATEISLRFCA